MSSFVRSIDSAFGTSSSFSFASFVDVVFCCSSSCLISSKTGLRSGMMSFSSLLDTAMSSIGLAVFLESPQVRFLRVVLVSLLLPMRDNLRNVTGCSFLSACIGASLLFSLDSLSTMESSSFVSSNVTVSDTRISSTASSASASFVGSGSMTFLTLLSACLASFSASSTFVVSLSFVSFATCVVLVVEGSLSSSTFVVTGSAAASSTSDGFSSTFSACFDAFLSFVTLLSSSFTATGSGAATAVVFLGSSILGRGAGATFSAATGFCLTSGFFRITSGMISGSSSSGGSS
eukprot:09886.XXX_420221_421090_1 [CDS] Oithona nana genome sequencing.